MNDVLLTRLEILRNEHRKGGQRLRELQAQTLDIEQTLLRIEGAITVLQELVKAPNGVDPCA